MIYGEGSDFDETLETMMVLEKEINERSNDNQQL